MELPRRLPDRIRAGGHRTPIRGRPDAVMATTMQPQITADMRVTRIEAGRGRALTAIRADVWSRVLPEQRAQVGRDPAEGGRAGGGDLVEQQEVVDQAGL